MATPRGTSYLAEGFAQVRNTLRNARRFKDLFRFLMTLVVFQAGVSTVIVVAAIYAQEVLEFSSDELIFLVMVINVTAAVGALAIGHLQGQAGLLPRACHGAIDLGHRDSPGVRRTEPR